ncbi:cytidylate kinase [Acetoanaerobium noterae]|uniref:Cytidylate kinase n=1 Tax=Acetoanaerobium noterae TaxID=745369 RepID=A0A1T4ZQQ6_9FIRM|nr:(d)CMP kinase [Acetoanaerobium noterae]SKB25082.1 cytidylate kinase [Acetoanaerobium noterae]
MIIAIDGPAGAGKSTIAKKVADSLGYVYIDTGAMYRAFTYELLTSSISLSDIEEITKVLEKTNIEFKNNEIFLNNLNVTNEIRSKNVTANVSTVSAIPQVREKLVDLQRKIASESNSILDGRDIGTVVFPNAELKIFLTASVKIRALRRYNELIAKDKNIDINEIEAEIEKRDKLDSSRETSPLIKASDAIEIDTSDLSIDEVANTILKLAEEICENESL